MAKKPVKLACYEIVPAEIKLTKVLDIVSELSEIFTSATLDDRCRPLSDISVDGEQEFITKQKKSGNGLFCTFLHLKAGGAILISKDQMSEKEISLEEIATTMEENTRGHLKDYTYFLITNKLIILKATKGIPSSDIEIYLNWLLKKSYTKYAGKNSIFTLKTLLKKTFDPKTVGTIELGNNVQVGEKKTIDTVTRSIVKDIDKILKAQGFDDIETGEIIDAHVILKILKPSKKDDLKSKKAIQSIIKAFKNDETVIKDRRGQPICIGNIKETKEVRVPYLTTDFPDVTALETHMLQYNDEVSRL
jgi:hypothetical protein